MSRPPRLLLAALLLLPGCAGSSDGDGDDGEDGDDGAGGSMTSWVATGSPTRLARLSDGALAWTIDPAGCETDQGEQVCSFDVSVTGEAGQGWCRQCTDQELEIDLRMTGSGQLVMDSIKLVSGAGMAEGVRIPSMDLPLTPTPPHVLDEVVLVGGEVFGVSASFLGVGWTLLDSGPGFTDATGTTWNGCRTFAYIDVGGDSDVDGGAVVTTCAGVGVVQVGLTEGGTPGGANPYGPLDASRIFTRSEG